MWNENGTYRQLRAVKTVNKTNPLGLKLNFSLQDNTALTEFTLNENHQGLDGYVHRGLIACLMDEGMGWISRHSAGVNSVTARMQVNFHNSARINEPLKMISRITKSTNRLLEVEVQITNQQETLIAVGTCVQFVMGMNPDKK